MQLKKNFDATSKSGFAKFLINNQKLVGIEKIKKKLKFLNPPALIS